MNSMAISHPITPPLHHSNPCITPLPTTPSLHHSITPFFSSWNQLKLKS
jgi:hypothetical protein